MNENDRASGGADVHAPADNAKGETSPTRPRKPRGWLPKTGDRLRKMPNGCALPDFDPTTKGKLYHVVYVVDDDDTVLLRTWTISRGWNYRVEHSTAFDVGTYDVDGGVYG